MGYALKKRHDAGGLLGDYLRVLDDAGNRLLTAQEECALARLVAAGDEEARNRLVQANAKLVVRIATQYKGRGLSLDDLVGEGNLGLIRAAKEFDPAFGTRFSTYSAYWIKQSIRLALTNTSAMIRIPSHIVALLQKWAREQRLLERELDREATFDEIADRLQLNDSYRDHVRNALRAKHLKLESCHTEEETSWRVDQVSENQAGPDNRLEKEEQRLWLMRGMTRLSDLERAVITLRYGLHGEESLTWCEIGEKLGVTREWARKIELRALDKLRTCQATQVRKVKAENRVKKTLIRKPPEAPSKPANPEPRYPMSSIHSTMGAIAFAH